MPWIPNRPRYRANHSLSSILSSAVLHVPVVLPYIYSVFFSFLKKPLPNCHSSARDDKQLCVPITGHEKPCRHGINRVQQGLYCSLVGWFADMLSDEMGGGISLSLHLYVMGAIHFYHFTFVNPAHKYTIKRAKYKINPFIFIVECSLSWQAERWKDNKKQLNTQN